MDGALRVTKNENAKALKLILMGTGPFAVPSFDALLNSGHEIALVVTKPQPPVKSRKGPPPAPVRTWATESGLPVFDPQTINEPEAVARVASESADLLVVCDYGHILKPDALATATLGGINLHGSLLPAYRGAAPVQRALLSGDATTGVTVIHMTPRLDGGPILCTRSTEIRDDETAGELEERLSRIGVDATLEAVTVLTNWDGESVIGTKQDPSKVTKAARLSKAEAEIDWNRTSREIDCHVRGMQPWPVAFTFMTTNPEKPPLRIAIKKVKRSNADRGAFASGQFVGGDGFLVATGDGVIEIVSLQPAGKREMEAAEFLRGHNPKPGAQLGK